MWDPLAALGGDISTSVEPNFQSHSAHSQWHLINDNTSAEIVYVVAWRTFGALFLAVQNATLAAKTAIG